MKVEGAEAFSVLGGETARLAVLRWRLWGRRGPIESMGHVCQPGGPCNGQL